MIIIIWLFIFFGIRYCALYFWLGYYLRSNMIIWLFILFYTCYLNIIISVFILKYTFSVNINLIWSKYLSIGVCKQLFIYYSLYNFWYHWFKIWNYNCGFADLWINRLTGLTQYNSHLVTVVIIFDTTHKCTMSRCHHTVHNNYTMLACFLNNVFMMSHVVLQVIKWGVKHLFKTIFADLLLYGYVVWLDDKHGDSVCIYWNVLNMVNIVVKIWVVWSNKKITKNIGIYGWFCNDNTSDVYRIWSSKFGYLPALGDDHNLKKEKFVYFKIIVQCHC